MKKLWLTAALCTALLNPAFAQRKQTSRDFVKGTEFDLITIPGTERYSYIVGQDGSNIKDGPYSVKCTLSSTRVDMWPYTFTINGTYSLNAAFSKGRLNGAVSSSFQMPLTKYRRSTGTERQTLSQTFSGNFINGVPNGTIVVSYNKLETRGKLVATYRNGHLTGSFSWYNNGLNPAKISGTAPAVNGKLCGSWTFENGLSKRTLQFQNGVLINTTVINQSRLNPENRSTRPAFVELSKKYASGGITKEELLKQNVVVRRDSIHPGNTARAVIFEDSGIDFEALGGYDFTLENAFGYEYLQEIPFLSERGANYVSRAIAEWVDRYGEAPKCLYYISASSKATLVYGNYLALDEEQKPYVLVNGYDASNRNLVTCDIPRDYVKVYVTDEQFDQINKAVHEALVRKACTLSEYLHGVTRIADLSDKSLKGVADGRAAARNKYEGFKAISSPSAFDPNYIKVLKEAGDKPVYVTKSSVEDYESVLKEYDDELIKSFTDGGFAPETARKVVEKELVYKMIPFASLCSYLAEARKPFNIEYGQAACDYFDDPKGKDLSSRIKPFCPIAACRIVDVNDDGSEIVLEISRENGKKKGNAAYRIPVKVSRGSIVVDSIDFSKALPVD